MIDVIFFQKFPAYKTKKERPRKAYEYFVLIMIELSYIRYKENIVTKCKVFELVSLIDLVVTFFFFSNSISIDPLPSKAGILVNRNLGKKARGKKARGKKARGKKAIGKKARGKKVRGKKAIGKKN